MYSATKQRTVEDGLCFRRDWTARLISIASGMTTNVGLVTWMASFGSDWTRFIAWPHVITTCYAWTWKTLKKKILMLSIRCLVFWVRKTSTSWSLVLIQVELSFRLFYSSHSKKEEGRRRGEGRGGEGRGGKRVLSNVNMLKLFSISSFENKKVTSAHRYAILDSAYQTLISSEVFAVGSVQCVVYLTN